MVALFIHQYKHVGLLDQLLAHNHLELRVQGVDVWAGAKFPSQGFEAGYGSVQPHCDVAKGDAAQVSRKEKELASSRKRESRRHQGVGLTREREP